MSQVCKGCKSAQEEDDVFADPGDPAWREAEELKLLFSQPIDWMEQVT